jgi:predicted transposase/invertase (TIGR01784 family)
MVLTEKYINPFTDFGFKKIFGSEPNKDLLIDFLNHVALVDKQKIKDLTYKKTNQLGKSESDRKAIFDLYCTGENDERFIVEMQKAKQNYFKDRSVFYASFPIQEQAQKGDWNFKLSDVYLVGILDFVFSDDEEVKSKQNEQSTLKKVRHIVQLKDEDCKVFYNKLRFVYLEMPNFNKIEDQLETIYDKWLYVLKHLPTFEKRPQKLQERIFEKLFETAEIAKFTPEERDNYEESLKTYWDLKNVIDTAKSDGEIEGIEKGIIQTAINAIKKNYPIDVIMDITGLSEEVILKLIEEHKS